MIDLDAPTPANRSLSELRHILAGNFKAQTADDMGLAPLTNSTPAVTPFFPPGPAAPSGPHRFVLLLYTVGRRY